MRFPSGFLFRKYIKPIVKFNKFRAIVTFIDGIKFHSKREAKRYSELKLLERAGAIQNLTLQRRFPLVVNDIKICLYIADFCYFEHGSHVVEDSKGFKTPAYRLKAKLMLACYGIKIKET